MESGGVWQGLTCVECRRRLTREEVCNLVWKEDWERCVLQPSLAGTCRGKALRFSRCINWEFQCSTANKTKVSRR